MPLPIAPIAGIALRYGAVALAGAYIAKRTMKTKTEKCPHREATMETVKDGFDGHRIDGEDEVQVEGSHGAWKRIWLGNRGLEIDTRVLGRLRIRKLNESDKT